MYPAAFLSDATAKLRPLLNLMEQKQLLEDLDHIQLVLSRLGEQIQLHSYLYRLRIDGLEELLMNLEDFAEVHQPHQTGLQSTLPAIFQKFGHMRMSPVHAQVREASIQAADIFSDPFPLYEINKSSRYDALAGIGRDEVDPNNMVGMNTEREILVKRLADSSSCEDNLEVIPIVGNRGIGKTTLARLVYTNSSVCDHFEVRYWTNVSRNSSLRDILKTWQQEEEGTSENTDQEIMQRVGDLIGGRRWLLVLDGVEKENEDLVRRLLGELKGASRLGSKLLITTRSTSLSKSFTRHTPPIHLQRLSEWEAWVLLKSADISFMRRWERRKVDKIGMKIANDICKGVPLAIQLIKHFLVEISSDAWQCVLEHGLQNPSHIFPADVETFESLQSKLELLPANVQLCFCYCGLLPKGHDINLDELIALWMAQGFINSDSNERAEDIGYDYFQKLHELKLFSADENDGKKEEWGRHRSFRMQDLMHDLALYVSCKRIILMDAQGDALLGRRVPHVALDFNLDSSWQIPKPLLMSQERLRTILLSPQSRLPQEVKLSTNTSHEIFSSFNKLRVLGLHDLGMMTISDSLGNLKQLRYLDLSSNSFVTLPRCTTSLFYLQTLKLSNCHKLKELPVGFKNLVNLRHLYIDGCFALTHMPLGLESMTSLQILSTFVVSKIRNSANLEQLKNLDNLRGNLEILHLERGKCNASKSQNRMLDKKQELECLTLRWNRDFDDEEDKSDKGDDENLLKILEPHPNLKALCIMGFKGILPDDYFSVPINLVKISLYHCPLIQFLPPLHQLSSLKVLELQRLEAMEYVAGSSAPVPTKAEPFFPSLKEVTIWDCPRLTSWWESEDPPPDVWAFKGIEKLEIRYCPKLTTFPFNPEKLILVSYSKDQLEQIMNDMVERPSSSYSAASSSSLKSFTIGRIDDLESLSEEGLKALASLQSLHIHDCHKLTSLLHGIQHLLSLEYLNVANCVKLNLGTDEEGQGSQWMGLVKLQTLIIRGIPNLESLPQGLQHAKSLQNLQLYSCPKLKSLPKWIGQLTFLDAITIEDCPKLLPRIQPETGEDWPLVANKLK